VAASGHEWTFNRERGVYKTTDGGETWSRILYVNEQTGAIDLVMDPIDHDTLYAATWQRVRKKWNDPRNEPHYDGSGIWKSTNGGRTWKPLTSGLPDTKYTGRIGLDLCASKPSVVYAYVDNHTPTRQPSPDERDSYGRQRTYPDIVGAEVYRSDDQGETWIKVNPSDRLFERFGGTYGWVFGQIRVDPNNENTVYLMGLGLYKSTDGGKTWTRLYWETFTAIITACG